MVFVAIFCLYSAWAVYLTAEGLFRKGLNREIKMLFLKRQIMFFIIVIATQVIAYITASQSLFVWVDEYVINSQSGDQGLDKLNKIAWKTKGSLTAFHSIGRIVFCSRGLMLFIWLCICPLFRHLAWFNITTFYKRVKYFVFNN